MRRRLAGAIAAVFLVAVCAATLRGQARESRMVFLGDTGTGGSKQRAVRDQLLRFPTSLAFLLGDNIYERGSKELFEERFDRVYAPVIAKGTRFHATLGNHDVSTCTTRTTTIERLPDDAEAYRWDIFRCDVKAQLNHPTFGYIDGHRYYSVRTDAGSPPLGEIFVLDSNTLRTSQTKLGPLQTDRAQIDWLERSLATSRARWKMAIMHHPMHSPAVPAKTFFFVPLGEGRAREIRLEQQIAPILKKHGVDVVLAGHNHFYARMWPQDGIRYFVSGGGGRSVYDFKEDEEYVAAGGGFYHFLYVRLTPERFEYYVVDDDGRSRDAGWWAKGDAADRPFPAGTFPPRMP
jgi:predicted phosphodiesterase